MLGIGVMIQSLGGNEETVKAVKGSLGKTIASLALVDDILTLGFTDETKLSFSDEGQSCCEHRYMTTGDDLSSFVGAQFTDVELREAPSLEVGYGEHEVQFLVISTDRGNVTVETHNEHNGYYGWFWICARN